jgi:DNA-binding MarR family transcriptional regulator
MERELKTAGLPPLSWYDVLLELRRAEGGCLAPRDLEREMLFEQYNLSRLLDRMEAQGLVHRLPYPGDKRRQLIAITKAGRELRKRMWRVYGAAIRRHVGSRLAEHEAETLARLLRKLIGDDPGAPGSA